MDREQRQLLVDTLRGLDAADDQEALSNARKAAGLVAEAGLDWADLIAPTGGNGDLSSDFDHGSIDFDDDEEGAAPGAPVDDIRLSALIQRLIQQDTISAETRSDLDDYAADLSAGRLEAADRAYIVALAARLKIRG